MRPAEVAAAFVACINAHDLAGLSALMTDDHVFVDALDNRGAGRDAARAGWKQYLALVPDYWIKVDTALEEHGTVALFGRAGGTYAGSIPKGESGRWEVPAAWLAGVRDDRVAIWRVYADNLPMRRLMGQQGVVRE
ncbi:MAG TPA: nuclear transport factor 2 family protein [Gemmatimonadales bacterium]|nr:nuclear transport factor 2 family protein [Gemmatimonadales bacterium]